MGQYGVGFFRVSRLAFAFALLGFKTTGPTLNLAMQWTNER